MENVNDRFNIITAHATHKDLKLAMEIEFVNTDNFR